MSYLITGHVLREKPDFARLTELPLFIGYRLYLHRVAELYLLDTFRSTKVPPYPFQTLLRSADIPLKLPLELAILERLYSQLAPLNLADGFKTSYIHASLLLSRLVQAPVFSFASNDDELDFTCSATDGTLDRLKCRCGDLVISYDYNRVEVAPLTPEAEEDDEFLTDTEGLKSTLSDVNFLPRETPWNSQLHAIALEELKAFAGINDAILGLGSFDPPEDESDWELVASR